MIRNRWLLNALAVTACLITQATAAEIFVDPHAAGAAGADANPGTLEQPLKSVNEAVRRVKPGDTIYLRAGDYPPIRLDRIEATDAKPIALAAHRDEAVRIRGDDHGVRLQDCRHVRIRGFEITGATGDYSGGVRIQGGGYNTVERCHIHHNDQRPGTMGVIIAESSFNRVLDNHIHHNSLSGVMVSSSPKALAEGNQIIGNHIHDHKKGKGDADGISVNGVRTAGRDSYSAKTLIQNNRVHDNADDGIDTWNTRDNVVIGNVCYDNGDGGDGCGFKLGGAGENDDVGFNRAMNNIAYNNKYAGFECNGSGGNVFYHNVAVGNEYGFLDSWRTKGQSDQGPTLVNNIAVNNRKTNLELFSGHKTICDYNLWHDAQRGANVKFAGETFSRLEDFRKASGLDGHSLAADPRFVDAATADFRLAPDSPARQAGDPANPARVKSSGLRLDIGRHESASD